MGISDFVEHTRKSSFGGQFLEKWKDDKKIVVWLHRLVTPTAVWSHSFCHLDVIEDKETGRPRPIMRYPRYVSPDPETVHRNQFFRNDDDTLRMPPDRDPFLLLREWLRKAESIALEQAVFKWTNPKNNEVQTWTRGELSGLVKRGRNFGHSLDTKQEYIFAVVQNDAPKDGVFLARETALLGKRIAEVIRQRQDEHGEVGGDPTQHPYSFVWAYDEKAKSPMDSYKAWKGDHECTQEIWDAISSENPPELAEFARPKDGDQEKIRAAMEAAAQVELPLDEVFSEEPSVRFALATGRARPRPARSGAAAPQAGGRPPPATRPGAPPPPKTTAAPPAAQRPAAAPRPAPGGRPPPAATRPPAAAAAPENGASRQPRSTRPAAPVASPAPPSTAPRTRRRKVEEPPPAEPEPEPEPPAELETVDCDDCGTAMPASETKCPKCGAEYEIDEDETDAEQLDAAAAPSDDEQRPAEVNEEGDPICWSCKGLVVSDKCTLCGIEQSDDIPF